MHYGSGFREFISYFRQMLLANFPGGFRLDQEDLAAVLRHRVQVPQTAQTVRQGHWKGWNFY